MEKTSEFAPAAVGLNLATKAVKHVSLGYELNGQFRFV